MFERGLTGGDVEFIFDVAHKLLEYVLNRDDACGRAEFVDDDGEMAAAFFEFGQQFGQNFCFGNHQNVVHDLTNLHAGNAG